MENPLSFLKHAKIEEVGPTRRMRSGTAVEELPESEINLDNLPDGVISSNLLFDLSAVKDANVRSGLSLATLFANRYATAKAGTDDPDGWLSEYQNGLTKLGFALTGTARSRARFNKIGAVVHESLIPFLTIALGGAAVGPIIIAALENLKKTGAENSPWITLFERESKRLEIHEMHFAAALGGITNTEIRYAVARLNIEQARTQVLFFKITKDTADYESLTTSLTANNSLLAVYENDLKQRLQKHVTKFIWDPGVDLAL